MLLRILAVGDVVSEAGLAYLERRLRRIQQEHNVDFTVVNGENAAGIGVLPWQAQAILDAGADVVTLGNHTWGKLKIHDFLDDCRACLRPANFAPELPGNGWGILRASTACGWGSSISLAESPWTPMWTTPSGRQTPFWSR